MNNSVNGGVADTANLTLCDVALERAMTRTNSLPGLVCMYGPSGYGKTMAAIYAANRRRAFYVQAQSVWTKKATLKAILKEMSIKPAYTIPDMLDQVALELAQSGRPLIVDEMDQVVERNNVWLICDIYEASQSPILLIGEEQLPTKLKKWERFHGRVLAWVPAQPVTLEDAHKLTEIYAPDIQVADDMLQLLVELASGSVRRIAVNLELINEVAMAEGFAVADRATWGRRELYTGEAPKRRL